MKRNRPIKNKIIKRTPDVRGQIHAAISKRENQMGDEVKFLQGQLNAGDESVEKLKEQIVATKRANNTTRVGALAATAAGTLGANLIFLQGGTPTDTAIKYGIALGACIGSILMNWHFNKTDITMTEMLKRANAWSRQEFTPEEVQTFKELYEEVKNDFDQNSELKKDVKSNFVYQTSQGVILALAIACLASAADKVGYGFMDYISQQFEDDNILELDATDPMLKIGIELNFSKL
jgi:glycerophosphoryl diester phosphodiesterase